MVNINSLERDGLRQAEICPRNTMMMNTNVCCEFICGAPTTFQGYGMELNRIEVN